MRILLFVLLFFQSSGEGYDYEVDAVAEVSQEGIISISGTTKLPDDSVFTITLSYGKSGDVNLARKSVNVAGSEFSASFDIFGGGIFPGTYNIEVLFNREAQPAKVANIMGTYLKNWGKKLAVNSGKESEAETIKTALKEELFNIAKELDELRNEIDTEFRKVIKDVNDSSFIANKNRWLVRIGEVTKKINDASLKYKVTKLITPAGYVTTLSNILVQIIRVEEKSLVDLKSGSRSRELPRIIDGINSIHADFMLKFQDAISAFGITKGQKDQISEILAKITQKWQEFGKTADKEDWQIDFAELTMHLANLAPHFLDREILEISECSNALANQMPDSEKRFSQIMAKINERLK